MRIVLLGTSSAIPTLTRGLSSTALVREGDVFLFDCGEGTQVQLMRSTVKRSRIHSIFIGHLHGDHLYGIAGLLSTLHLDGHEAPVNVFGPEGLRHFLTAAFRTSDLKFKFDLTVKEFGLLEYLMQRAGRCCSRSELLQEVWQMSPDAGTNVVDVYVNYLRKKLGAATSGEGSDGHSVIETVRGEGYRVRSMMMTKGMARAAYSESVAAVAH